MTTLRELIARRMVGEAMSLDDVVVKAQKRGEKLGRSNLHKLTKDAPLSLTAATIRGLAAGLGVTPLSVATAALESMGIDTRPVEITDSLLTIDIDPTLSEQDRKYLSSLIREMRDAHDVALRDATESGTPGQARQSEKTSVDEAQSRDADGWFAFGVDTQLDGSEDGDDDRGLGVVEG